MSLKFLDVAGPLMRGGRLGALLWSFSGQVAVSAVALAGSAASAQLLGPGGKGELAVLTLAGIVAANLLSFGVPYGLARAYLLGRAGAVLGSAVAHAVIALPVGLAAWLAVPLVAPVSHSLLAVVLFVVVPASVFSEDVGGALIAAKSLRAWQLARLLSVATFSAGVALLLVLDRPSVPAALTLFAAGSLAAAGVQAVVAHRRWGLRSRLSWTELRDVSARNYVGLLADRLLVRVDQFIVAGVCGSAAVGIYGVAVNVSEVGQYLGNAFGMSVVEDRASLPDRDILRIAALAAGAVGLLMVPVCFAAWFLVAPVFGDGFRDARLAAMLLAPGVAAKAAAVVIIQPLMARGEGRVCSVISGTALLAGVVAWYLGAELGGINGAAIANSLVYALQALLLLAVMLVPAGRAARPRS